MWGKGWVEKIIFRFFSRPYIRKWDDQLITRVRTSYRGYPAKHGPISQGKVRSIGLIHWSQDSLTTWWFLQIRGAPKVHLTMNMTGTLALSSSALHFIWKLIVCLSMFPSMYHYLHCLLIWHTSWDLCVYQFSSMHPSIFLCASQ